MTPMSDSSRIALGNTIWLNQPSGEGQGSAPERRFALLGLFALFFEEVIGSLIFIVRAHWESLRRIPLVETGTVLTHWVLPALLVKTVERQGLKSLGLDIPKRKRIPYALYTIVALILPGVILGFDQWLLVEFIEQVVYIGLAEEVFFRGYLLERLRNWLGGRVGLLVSAVIFSFAHILSRLSQGITDPMALLQLGIETLLGGLLLGFIYLRSGNIVPASLLHISMNLYLSRIFP